MTTVWGQDERFVQTYFTSFPGKQIYTTFDWGIRDKDGYYFILGRTDDVINVAGHRLGTREIEEAISAHAAIAEVAVVGVADQLKGQMPMAFAVVKDPAQIATPEQRAALEKAVMGTVDGLLGPSPGRRTCISSTSCRRRAPARCCAAPSRPSPRAAIRAT
jgi:propionyl-CoA synthetase